MIEITQEQIMQNWNGEIPLVSISCITYNHEPYIVQALNGFLMQKTTFPFEVLIHDDASTDGTTEIIKDYAQKYPEIIKPLYEEENQWIKGRRGSAEFNFPRAKGKYIAFCEGDDYWIDENKLQMQVDFLENNPEYGMCYTKTKKWNELKQCYSGLFGSGEPEFEKLMLEGNRIPTLTVCLKSELMSRYLKDIEPKKKGWLMGDIPMWLYFAYNSKIKFLDEITAVYRVLEKSASHFDDINSQLDFNESCFALREFYIKKYNLTYDLTFIYDRSKLKIYLYNLMNKYNSNIAKSFRECYKESTYKDIKYYIYYVCSISGFIWNVMLLIKKCWRRNEK